MKYEKYIISLSLMVFQRFVQWLKKNSLEGRLERAEERLSNHDGRHAKAEERLSNHDERHAQVDIDLVEFREMRKGQRAYDKIVRAAMIKTDYEAAEYYRLH